MKYQIYLKKDASELINKMAETAGTTPAHFLKLIVEEMTDNMADNLEVILHEISEATKSLIATQKR